MTKRENLRIRDPFIFVRDNKYYLLGTTGTDPWIKGSDLILYESEDLENFREKCAMVKKEYLEGYTNIWAPELHEYKGKYYLIFSVFKEEKGRGSIIFVSDDLNGNFKPLTGEYVTPQNWGASTPRCLSSAARLIYVFQTNGPPRSRATETAVYLSRGFPTI